MVASRRCQESQFRGGRLPRVHCMSTYFFLNLIMRGYEGSIQRWNKDVDIFTFHMVLVPIHLQEHWCLAIIDFRNKVCIFQNVNEPWTVCEMYSLLNGISCRRYCIMTRWEVRTCRLYRLFSIILVCILIE